MHEHLEVERSVFGFSRVLGSLTCSPLKFCGRRVDPMVELATGARGERLSPAGHRARLADVPFPGEDYRPALVARKWRFSSDAARVQVACSCCRSCWCTWASRSAIAPVLEDMRLLLGGRQAGRRDAVAAGSRAARGRRRACARREGRVVISTVRHRHVGASRWEPATRHGATRSRRSSDDTVTSAPGRRRRGGRS